MNDYDPVNTAVLEHNADLEAYKAARAKFDEVLTMAEAAIANGDEEAAEAALTEVQSLNIKCDYLLDRMKINKEFIEDMEEIENNYMLWAAVWGFIGACFFLLMLVA